MSDSITSAPDKGIVAGFKQFILRGNAVEMAVGVVLGAAFKAVVDAIVGKFLNPLVGGLVGKPNFDHFLEFHIGKALVQPGAIFTQVINFLLVAAAIYLLIVVPFNRLHQITESKAAEVLLEKIGIADSDKSESKKADENPKKTSEPEPGILSETEQQELLHSLKRNAQVTDKQNEQLQLLAEIRDLLAKNQSR